MGMHGEHFCPAKEGLMLKVFKNPAIQIACLLVAWALVCLPNLGISSLWDIDEGNNAEAAYEMMESGNWIVPTYNYNLRVDKPALLYWLQIASYNTFGVNEFAARFPSALGGLFSLFATYALATIMFGASTGFFAGLILLAMPAWAGAQTRINDGHRGQDARRRRGCHARGGDRPGIHKLA